MTSWLMLGSSIWYVAIAVSAAIEGKPWLGGTMFLYALSIGTLYMAATK
jgi:hypothetical protein